MTRLPILTILAAIPLIGGAAVPERGYPVADFQRIVVEGPYDVQVEHGAVTAARAEGSARALARLQLGSAAGTLTIRSRSGPGALEPARIVVTTPMLTAATLFGGGRLTVARLGGRDARVALNGDGALAVQTVAAERLSAMATGAGEMVLAGSAREALVGGVGAPRIDGDALKVEALTVNAQGPVTAALRATGTARVIATGPTAIRIRGGARCIVRGADVAAVCGE